MSANTTMLLSIVLLSGACATDELDSDPIELAGDSGKDDGIAGKTVVTNVIAVGPVSLMMKKGWLGNFADLSDSTDLDATNPWRVHGSMYWLNSDATVVKVVLGPDDRVASLFHESRFFLYQYTGDGTPELDWKPGDWKIVDCRRAVGHVNLFSGVTIDRTQGKLETREGSKFDLTACGISNPSVALAMFPMPTSDIRPGASYWKLHAECVTNQGVCWDWPGE